MANATVNRQVNVYINSGEAQKAYDLLIAKEKKLNEELAKTTDPKRIKQLNNELGKLTEPIDRAKKKLAGELAPTVKDLQRSVRKLVEEFERTGDPKILSKIQALNTQLKEQKKVLNGLDDAQQGLTKKGIFSAAFWASLASGLVVKATAAIGNFFGGAIQEALDADAATKRLTSTLENLGRSDAIDRITRKADELAQKFRYLDNDDIVAVFNRLIDYGKLTEKQMNELLPVIIDFAAKSQITIDESAGVIINALEGNGKALKQYGINIKDAGTETDRLNEIMTTLKGKVDGSGEAFMKSAKGGIMTARQELKNLQEDIGNKLIPILNTLLGWVVDALNGLKKFFNQLRDGFKEGFSNAGRSFASVIKELAQKGINESINKQILDTLQKVNDTIATEIDKQKLGISSKDKPDGGAAKKAIEELKKLLEDVDKIRKSLFANSLPALERELQLVDDKYAELIKRAKGNKEIIIQIEQLHGQERIQIIQEFARKEIDIWEKAGMKINEAQDKLMKDNMKRLADTAKRVLTGSGSDFENIRHTKLTDINDRLQQEQWEEEKKQLEERLALIEKIKEALTTAITIYDTFAQAASNRENADLERDRRINDKKRANLENRLRKGLITQLQYDREVQRLNAAQEKKEREIQKKQFERQRLISISEIIIDGAKAAADILAKNAGNPLKSIPLLIVTAATIASKIALVNSQEPKFAAGGRLGGRSHASGGNAVVDGSGQKIAEVEAGEGIVNKKTMADGRRYSVHGTPSQIISRLNSMYGTAWEGGATLIPSFRMFSPQQMNFAAMKGIYAAGGRFESNSSSQAFQENNTAAVDELRSSIAQLNSILSNGIIAYSVLTQQEKQQLRLDSIRKDATMKG